MNILFYIFISLFSITVWADGHDQAEVGGQGATHGDHHDHNDHHDHHQGHEATQSASHTNMGSHQKQKGLLFYGDLAVSMSYQGDESYSGSIQGTGAPGNNLRHAHFNGNLAEFNVEKNWGHSHFHFSFGAGQTLADINRSAKDGGVANERVFHVTNAYYQLDSPYGLSLKSGLFESPMGYESFNSMDNPQFSRSWGFSLVPYFHSGISLAYNFKDMFKIEAAVVNGVNVDDLLEDGNENKHMLVTVEVHPIENLSLEVKYMGGKQTISAPTLLPPPAPTTVDLGVTQGTIEATAAYRVNKALDFAVNYTRLDSDSSGGETTSQSIAVYANGSYDKYGLGLRFEHFGTDNFSPFGIGTFGYAFATLNQEIKITSLTFAPSVMVDENAKIVLEVRTDSSEDEIWVDADGAAKDSSISATLGFMYRW